MKTIIDFKEIEYRHLFCRVLFVGIFWIFGCSEETINDLDFGTLTGNVVSKGDNTPLKNVKISTSPVSNTVFTDNEGNFILSDIQSGEYSVQADLLDFQTSFEPANVLEGRATNIVFELDSTSIENKAPLAPNLIFPEENTDTLGTKVTFQWSSSKNDDDEINYMLELRNGASNEVTIYNEIKDTLLVVENLTIGSNYFWQISATDGNGLPVKSTLGGFATKGNALNRFLYVRNIDGNNVLFSGSEPIGSTAAGLNQNELQLTKSIFSSYKPVKNNTVNKVAFLRNVGAETHLFTMNLDGSNLLQVTKAVPLAGFREDQLGFSWYDGGAKFYFANFNKLYAMNQDGSGLELVYQTDASIFITDITTSSANDLVAIKTNDLEGYSAKISLIDVNTDTEEQIIISGEPGAIGGLDFSSDGLRIIFTRDVSGAENTEYRQFDSRIFEYVIATDVTTEIDTSKEDGTNDFDAQYAPNDGAIIFVNTSNDGVSENKIYRVVPSDNNRKQTLFYDAFMPNWE
ncbi:carboxypeptidase-like regulatory domain-containing protein [Zobellia alginiliquefaciens]|uniref:carboxypeptidase-like regulatory domain-containing protein n=1 Tax=Zobellia alginiliquefaciens TaxID=3032586 RepID=UPI0023E12BED|nr:carboxypeptidase-like regulatory domain-containing protein [Zobellia alginiliquefaciens]